MLRVHRATPNPSPLVVVGDSEAVAAEPRNRVPIAVQEQFGEVRRFVDIESESEGVDLRDAGRNLSCVRQVVVVRSVVVVDAELGVPRNEGVRPTTDP